METRDFREPDPIDWDRDEDPTVDDRIKANKEFTAEVQAYREAPPRRPIVTAQKYVHAAYVVLACILGFAVLVVWGLSCD